MNYDDIGGYKATLSEPGALTAALNWYRANVPLDRLISTGAGPQLRLEGAGHFIPLEEPERLNELLLDFLPRP